MVCVGRKNTTLLTQKSDRKVVCPLGWFFLLVIHPLSFFLLFDPASRLPIAGQMELLLSSDSAQRLGTLTRHYSKRLRAHPFLRVVTEPLRYPPSHSVRGWLTSRVIPEESCRKATSEKILHLRLWMTGV